MVQRNESAHFPLTEDAESLDELRGDCARMTPHWKWSAQPTPEPTTPAQIHGVEVPDTSAHLLDGMSEYGD